MEVADFRVADRVIERRPPERRARKRAREDITADAAASKWQQLHSFSGERTVERGLPLGDRLNWEHTGSGNYRTQVGSRSAGWGASSWRALRDGEDRPVSLRSKFKWAQLSAGATNQHEGTWALVEDEDGDVFVITEDGRTTNSFHRLRWAHHCPIEEILHVGGQPSTEVIRAWKRSNSGVLRRAFDSGEGMGLRPGWRVTLVEAPWYLDDLRDGYIVGLVGSSSAPLVIVRVSCGGEPLDSSRADFVKQLTAKVQSGDLVPTWLHHLRRHFFAGEGMPVVGERVETGQGTRPYRRGFVQEVLDGGGGKRVRLWDEESMQLVDVEVREVQRRFEKGDSVKVVEGFYEGRRGTVVEVFDLIPEGYAAPG
uniref:KOW domain-containing protein n=1 Tax=Mycena chlorophos TaxID=658473 RepID=A0ABQ0KXQ0_MYCCL|nr:predicted protein [Mycena chlorophos]